MMAPVEIAGLGLSLPKTVVTNDDLAKIVDTSDEWIVKRTGIRTRHIAADTTAVDMGEQAAAKAVAHAGLAPADIGLIIASTMSSESLMPSMACRIQRALGIESCASMDVSAACTGFVYALVTAASMMDALGVDAALVVASESLSAFIDWTDRSTCVLFGDGAGAVVVKRSATNALHYPILGARPDHDDAIVLRRDARHTPFHQNPETDATEYLHMKGREVFAFATDALAQTLGDMQARCADKPFEKIIPHQANEKIIDCVIRNTGFAKEQFFVDIGDYANTSSATIPIAMVDAYEQGWLKAGDRVALVGFGAGLTYGGVVIDWTL
jgi:3-oxoacyl-[acyl-carrier-protein] synthase-3